MTAINTRAALRQLSQAWHQQAETTHWSQSGFRGRHGYDQFLHALHTAHSDLGWPAAVCLGDAGAIEHEVLLIDCLVSDLASARRACPASSLDRDYAWGVAYALTGSSIGAGVILASDSIASGWPKSYLLAAKAYAQKGGVRSLFDRLNLANPDEKRALQGVNAVFECMALGKPERP